MIFNFSRENCNEQPISMCREECIQEFDESMSWWFELVKQVEKECKNATLSKS